MGMEHSARHCRVTAATLEMRRISPNIELVLDARNHTGETPVWAAAEAALYWINVDNPPELLRWTPRSGEVRRWPMPERIGGFVLKQHGGMLVTLASGLFDFDLRDGALSMRVPSPLPADVALHECACDPIGRFWVGSIDRRVGPANLHPGGAKFFRLEDQELVPVVEDISCANGLAFSPDGRRLYLTDSTTGRCDLWDLDPRSGAIGNRRTLFQLVPGEGFVDGATVDSEGAYWCSIVYGGALRRYLPDGILDVEVRLPFENPTKVAFGGERLDRMFITTTIEGIGPDAPSTLNGGLFAFDPGVTGNPEILLPR